MSSACPVGLPPGQPGFTAQGEGKIYDIVLSSRKRGWAYCKFCKIADDNREDITGIYRFPQVIVMGNLTWREEEYWLSLVSSYVREYRVRPGEELCSLLRTGNVIQDRSTQDFPKWSQCSCCKYVSTLAIVICFDSKQLLTKVRL